MQTVKSLAGKTNFIIKAQDPSLKKGNGGGFESWNDHEFPKLAIFVLTCAVYSDSRMYIEYFNRSGTKKVVVVIPNTFKVKVISQTIPDKIMDRFIVNNLHTHVKRLGMTLGSDPEMFVEDDKGNVIPAYEFLGSKAKPSVTAEGTYGGRSMYWDGFQGEFETAPETCLGWQTDSVQCGLKGLLMAARKYNPKAKISSKTVVTISPELLQDAKEEHVQFGCMPSLNAYGMKGKLANGRDIPFRPAGGHIHFGINEYNSTKFKDTDYIKMVKALDAIVGVACVSLFATVDDPKRRELYGLAGEYRLPKHGLEYRVLSNAWLLHPMLMNLVFDISRIALTMGYKDMIKYWKGSEEETVECINKCDVKLARKILKRNEKIFLQIIKAAYGGFSEHIIKTVYNIFSEGMELAIKDPHDVHGNWNLLTNWIRHTNAGNKNTSVCIEEILSGKKAA